jgi:hypothetical protein
MQMHQKRKTPPRTHPPESNANASFVEEPAQDTTPDLVTNVTPASEPAQDVAPESEQNCSPAEEVERADRSQDLTASQAASAKKRRGYRPGRILPVTKQA